ncbi:hypothetical protein MSG28_003971 [Choristoneura fumiferana]|uniref:Uncharacterized protein n=1 Tax=Choristoneura fumiferana TaxID=7141 RepID=A0ACC0KGU7_CHOFU|nr:hypothetical protein MSG28_003971 [Choristoneura fumiferana]
MIRNNALEQPNKTTDVVERQLTTESNQQTAPLQNRRYLSFKITHVLIQATVFSEQLDENHSPSALTSHIQDAGVRFARCGPRHRERVLRIAIIFGVLGIPYLRLRRFHNHLPRRMSCHTPYSDKTECNDNDGVKIHQTPPIVFPATNRGSATPLKRLRDPPGGRDPQVEKQCVTAPNTILEWRPRVQIYQVGTVCYPLEQ